MMKAKRHGTQWKRYSAIVGSWEKEGGGLEFDSTDHHYGRRIRMDRTWTIRHIDSAVSAKVDGQALVCLNRPEATKGMLAFILRNTERRQSRNSAPRDRQRVSLSVFIWGALRKIAGRSQR
jgi:hypothetical protein